MRVSEALISEGFYAVNGTASSVFSERPIATVIMRSAASMLLYQDGCMGMHKTQRLRQTLTICTSSWQPVNPAGNPCALQRNTPSTGIPFLAVFQRQSMRVSRPSRTHDRYRAKTTS